MLDQYQIRREVEQYLSREYPEHYIVDVLVQVGNRIVIEIGCDRGVGIDECVRLTKHIESVFDREEEDYELEVGSSGLTAPLKVLRQYQACVDSELEVLRKGGVKEVGELVMASEQEIHLKVVRRVKPEGAKRKIDVEEVIVIPMEEVLQSKRIIKI